MAGGTSRLLPGVAWGCYVAFFTLLLYFQVHQFGSVFRTGADYGILAGLFVGTATCVVFLARRLPGRVLSLALISSVLGTVVMWYLVVLSLPAGTVAPGCQGPACSFWGQTILLVTCAACTLPLLVEWTRRVSWCPVAVQGSSSILVAGGLLIAAGILASIEVYLGFLSGVGILAFLLLAIAVFEHRGGATGSNKPGDPGARLVVNGWRMFRDVIMVLVVAALGFSTLPSNRVDPATWWQAGLGMSVLALVMHALRGTGQRDNAGTVALAERIILVLLGTSVLSVYWFVELGFHDQLQGLVPAAIPPFVIGIAYAFLWFRFTLLARNEQLPRSRYARDVNLPRPAGTSLALVLAVLLVFALAVTRIRVDTGTGLVFYPACLLLVGIALACNLAAGKSRAA